MPMRRVAGTSARLSAFVPRRLRNGGVRRPRVLLEAKRTGVLSDLRQSVLGPAPVPSLCARGFHTAGRLCTSSRSRRESQPGVIDPAIAARHSTNPRVSATLANLYSVHVNTNYPESKTAIQSSHGDVQDAAVDGPAASRARAFGARGRRHCRARQGAPALRAPMCISLSRGPTRTSSVSLSAGGSTRLCFVACTYVGMGNRTPTHAAHVGSDVHERTRTNAHDTRTHTRAHTFTHAACVAQGHSYKHLARNLPPQPPPPSPMRPNPPSEQPDHAIFPAHVGFAVDSLHAGRRHARGR